MAPLFTGVTPLPTLTTPSMLIRSLTLSHLNNSFKFEDIKETTDENTTAHSSVPMLKCPGDEVGPSS